MNRNKIMLHVMDETGNIREKIFQLMRQLVRVNIVTETQVEFLVSFFVSKELIQAVKCHQVKYFGPSHSFS